jgi:uncharacterized protein (DUF3084 family)
MDVKSLIQKLTGTAPVAEVPTAEETQAAIEALNTREEELATRETALTDRETSLNSKEADLSQKEADIAARETATSEKETALTTKETELTAKETELNDKEANLDSQIAEAAQKLSVQGTAPIKPEAKDAKAEIVAAYKAETDKAKKFAMFQQHEAILKAAK